MAALANEDWTGNPVRRCPDKGFAIAFMRSQMLTTCKPSSEASLLVRLPARDPSSLLQEESAPPGSLL